MPKLILHNQLKKSVKIGDSKRSARETEIAVKAIKNALSEKERRPLGLKKITKGCGGCSRRKKRKKQ
ncbi:hypothetical protein LCGC14_2816120 [marine sediment metagenome]|uniref:Uncharacterized protein n=1 Tax=marine sediment metagenome TaxID=412755 RepID=A0A0F8Z584_9ZZZZ